MAEFVYLVCAEVAQDAQATERIETLKNNKSCPGRSRSNNESQRAAGSAEAHRELRSKTAQ